MALFTAFPAAANSPLSVYPALMDTLVGGHYAAADSLCDHLNKTYPGHPGAVYAQIALLYARMIDYEDTSGLSDFVALVDSCVTLCDRIPKDQMKRAERHFLKGSAMSAHGILQARSGKTLSGIRLLMKARGEFDAAIKLDPEFFDACVGRGAYRYAAAQQASLWRWLPFVPTKQSGLNDLWLGARYSRFSRYTALSSMVWFIMDDGNYTLADSICQAGLERFPNSRPFLWPLLSLRVRQKQWAEAEQIALTLLEQQRNLVGNNGYETTGLYWRLMTCADALNRPVDAVRYAQMGLAVERTSDAEQRRAEKLAALRQRVQSASSKTQPDRGQ